MTAKNAAPGTKRRCAGCNRVIAGRPNKKYCSDTCRMRVGQQRHRNVDQVSTVSKAVPSVVRGSNGVLIAAVAQLGYLGQPDDIVLDTTYGRGLWWTRYRPEYLVALQGDFRDMDYDTDSIPVVCYDPPYISTGNRETSSVDNLYDRYGLGGLKGWRAIRELIDDGLQECWRVLRPRGYLLVKCMDYVESGRKVWNTFHVAHQGHELGLELVDRFHHLTGGGPQPTTNLDGSPREQKRAREVASMLLVFTK
jgi:hypothetical protein